MRYETPAPPAEVGKTDGLAYSLWLPEGDPWAGVVIIHGAGSSKESHHDFARAARSAGLSAVCFDQRGHGDSGGELDARALEDVATMAALLATSRWRRAARAWAATWRSSPPSGSARPPWWRSAPRAPTACRAACAAASSTSPPTCPRSRRSWPSTRSTAAHLAAPLLLLHAEGDERVPVAHSRELARLAPNARSSSSSPAAITARSSTTPSSRVTPCAGCAKVV